MRIKQFLKKTVGEIIQKSKIKKILLVSILLSVLTGLISWIPISYNLSFSSFYVSKEYNGDMVNLNEIIDKVENFDYETYLTCTQELGEVINYSSREILEKFSLKIEETRQQKFYLSAVMRSSMYYIFTAQNYSYFNFTYNSYDYDFSAQCAVLSTESTSIEICYGGYLNIPNWFFNLSYFQEPIENITDAQFSDIIIVTIELQLNNVNSNYNAYGQIVVLSHNLDIIFVVVFSYIVAIP